MANKLADQKSPYLKQHANNPVEWYPWGQEAIEKARQEEKPIFLSIGYSTCYWCHVMEKESFEDNTIAGLLNNWFVSIKVDREERPDLDQLYMDALVGLTGQGGWPMSVFLTPSLEPFYAGTYFPSPHFAQLLTRIADIWEKDREKALSTASEVSSQLALGTNYNPAAEFDKEFFERAFNNYKSSFDSDYGGFGRAPKFPPSQQIRFLLRYAYKNDNDRAKEISEKTLNCMAAGGLFDHLGGGFARYSTDERWLIPHFEKMLYDNALLAVAYLEGYQYLKQPQFLKVAEETLNYLIEEMQDSNGGFYSAEDAGEVGKEGAYYLWDYQGLNEALPPKLFELACSIFDLSESGNFEEGAIVLALCEKQNWPDRISAEYLKLREELLRVRNNRTKPARDNKQLCSWNSLAITALLCGYRVTRNEFYYQSAIKGLEFVLGTFLSDGKLYRRFAEGELEHPACLDDYAFCIEALLEAFQTDGQPHWLETAINIQEQQDRELWDHENGGYFYSGADDLIVKKKEIVDGALPSGNSVSIGNLLRLKTITAEVHFSEKADLAIKLSAAMLEKYSTSTPRALAEITNLKKDSRELVVAVDSIEALRSDQVVNAIWNNFAPDCYLIPSIGTQNLNYPLLKDRNARGSENTYYLCQEGECELPKTDPAEILIELNLQS